MKTRGWLCIPIVMFVVLLSSCTRGTLEMTDELNKPLPLNKTKITIGSKSMTEQYLLLKMTSLVLRQHGYPVNEMVTLDSDAVRSAMEAGVIDLYWEYTTTARQYYQKQAPIYDADEVFRLVSESDAKKGIIWLPRSQFNSSWALLMRDDAAKQLGIRTISDLARIFKEKRLTMKFATNDEYQQREDGMKRLQDIYDFVVPKNQIVAMDTSLLPQAVKEARVDVAVGLASDSRIKDHHLVIIEDDRHLFPPYHAAPVIIKKTLDQNEEISELIEPITEVIDNNNMSELMYQVDILHKDVTQTARNFLLQKHILQP
ncbi:glycine/betaine ABC transporter substrate-binding protein [Paenibacillus frigoriresistens]|uniref:ABC transporter substrate-binding protein n=1 Tax=Paenibacillus alginolyticus TaxID=59839 RepID=UPI001562F92D|nr:glycine betaine ABC transporter substrate-binding protein [Paenibacillus frigoriresistens]NRF92344.1 glycine/betaine ABC transporter substrate-binding protein [Paenibacillus frigoriresistens]